MGVSRRSNTLQTFSIVSVFFLLLATSSKGLRPYHFDHLTKGTEQSHTEEGEIGMELYPTGSSLPDCMHACGPCTPCRRVIVSYSKCSVESCPVVYRCICKGRYYHVPSN